ncbi:hypothetical protein B0T44_23485 [Nocardia donostiensis]|nr:hypothetical protein B0T36_16830 [Nocardia donostiensis]OQS17689.1 hypothetical protein B0T44_23485 [Nocardia donostiensis]
MILASIAATSATKILTTLISEWCAVDRNREIKVMLGSASLDVKGGGQHTRRVLDHFFADSADAGTASDETAELETPAPSQPDNPDDHGETPR